MQYAVQLYTLRKECEVDFFGTLEKVSELGYKGVELAGTYGVPALELKKHLDLLNLTVVASHVGLDELVNNYKEVIQYNSLLGNRIIVCPYSDIQTDEDTNILVEQLGSIIDEYNKAGMVLFYHNHAHELTKDKKGYLLDELFDNLSPKGLKMELDTHWVARAKVDVLDYINKNLDILELIHVKDLKIVDGNETTAALGQGKLPIIDIIKESEKAGIEWVIVEDDNPSPDGLTNVETSIKYLNNNLK